LEKVTSSGIPILLEGETGCSHEMYAKTLHKETGRPPENFYTIFCPSLTKGAIDNILCDKKNNGNNNLEKLLIPEDNSTIFLEKIDSLDLDSQNMLVKLLDIREKNLREDKQYNTNIVVGSEKNILNDGNFKKELFFKISGYIFEMLPLRERRDCIALLVKDLYKYYASQEQKIIQGINPTALKLLENYDWTGDIDELKNVIYSAVVVNTDGILSERDFINMGKGKKTKKNCELTLKLTDSLGNFKSLADIERDAINAYIQYFDGNLSKASRQLKVGRATLYRKLENDN
jgi:DNA-binding NtrC family response regulator